MNQVGLAPQLARFVADHVHSVSQLEILLFLLRQPERSFTAEEVVDALRLGRNAASEPLREYAAGGLLEQQGEAYRYRPITEGLAESAALLARAYEERRVSVIDAIYSTKQSAIQSFADAFRLKKE